MDLAGWAVAATAGLALAAIAVHSGAKLGTAAAPFLGRYRWHLTAASALAPAVATLVVLATVRRWTERLNWPTLLAAGYAAALAWTMSLTVIDGRNGFTRGLNGPRGYLSDLDKIGDHPWDFLRTFPASGVDYSPAARGHPPGPVLLLWALHRIGLTGLTLGVFLTAIGMLTVPLVLTAVRDSAGETAARRYAPVLCLAPSAIWAAASMDAVVALLGAMLIGAGVRASRRQSHGWSAARWAALAGLITGMAALFSYAIGWLGLSLVLLYFARRRPFLNIATGVSALVPVVAAQILGFGWVDGLLAAHVDYGLRTVPYRSVVWCSVLSVAVLLLVAGPPVWASARKIRNTPGWPFLVGAGSAVVFSVLAGLALGGAEQAWLPFFPWLTIAAVAPERPGGTQATQPLLLTATGALTALVLSAVIARPW